VRELILRHIEDKTVLVFFENDEVIENFLLSEGNHFNRSIIEITKVNEQTDPERLKLYLSDQFRNI
jgi:hypothetical protein